ncbi:MAG: hypothetical protein HY842_10545 [Bacteroidetes bacterium]|nr:hypothetical protein [Bacteroidota bacterium]
MKKLLLFLLVGITVASCGDDDMKTPVASVHLNMRAVYDGQPLVMYQAYTYPDGSLVRFQTFNFFISNITLLGEGDTPDAELSEVEFADFSNNTTLAEAETPQAWHFEEVPTGTYRGIQLNIGVPASLNNADAGNLDADHPLRQHFTTHFWSDWKSFIFVKSEGIYDLDGNGEFNGSDQGFEHHPGKDEALTQVTKLMPITLAEGGTFDLNLVADLLKIYVKNGDALDLSDPENSNVQQASDLPLMLYLMGNWEQALSVE